MNASKIPHQGPPPSPEEFVRRFAEEGLIPHHPGDRLDIPPTVEHAATVGPEGCKCIEAPR